MLADTIIKIDHIISELETLTERHIAASKISPVGEDIVIDVKRELLEVLSELKMGSGGSGSRPTITNLQVYPVKEPKGKLRAYARVLLDDQLQLTALKIYQGSGGLFVSYPADGDIKGEDYRQVYYPVTRELRDHIEAVVLEEYNKAMQ